MDALEAAHIRPYRHESDNAQDNGILLRADLHTLFDLDLLAIDPNTHNILVHETVQDVQYRQFHNQPIDIPDGGFDEAAIRLRLTAYRAKNE